jgi:hypothetical protein
MTPEEIDSGLTQLFGAEVVALPPNSWQVETQSFRLLVLLSDDQSWLRVLVPITSAGEAQPFLEELLEANFDLTQETRYAFSVGVLWGVFQHSREGLTVEDFSAVVKRLVSLRDRGLSDYFDKLIENRLRQIIRAAKMQGQSLESTLQTVDRFYEEGLMGDMGQSSGSKEATLEAWRYQLGRLWNEIE